MNFFRKQATPALPSGGYYAPRRKRMLPSLPAMLAGLALLLVAAFAGLIAPMGGVKLTLVFAGVLLVIPVVWFLSAKNLLPILLVFIFLIQGPCASILHIRAILWVGSCLAFLFLLRTVLEILLTKLGRRMPNVPWGGAAGIVIAAAIYLGFFFFGLAIGKATKLQMLSSIRFGVPMFGVLMVLAFTPFTEKRLLIMWRLIIGIMLLQLPVVFYQHFWGMGLIGWDAVVGTFGPGMSAVMVVFSIAALIYALACWSRGLMPFWQLAVVFVFAMANMLLGEVKAIVFWMPLALVLTLRTRLLRNVGTFIAYGCLLAVFMAGTFAAYKAMYWGEQGSSGNTVEQKLEHTGGYFFDPYEIQYGTGEVGRFASLYIWYRDPTPDAMGRLIGFGPGASADGESTGRGVIAMRYRPLHIDSTTLTALLWDLGVLGALSFVLIPVLAVLAAVRYLRRGGGSLHQQAMVDASAVTLVLMMTTLIYNRTLLVETSSQLLFLFCAGCIVQMCRFSAAKAPAPAPAAAKRPYGPSSAMRALPVAGGARHG
ncbi:hypothetical protein [Duganella sp. HH101]|uniref:hypothetical protein n=1 Tax=Duganella sp. HH101 TaxID=1781066 RepID=UPI0008756C25|nr:hypothetical protein [Duganella sp. HH101]OFA03346.1 hypothetical protein DUGA2_30730 [Duganella sp. HH101]